jgi:hypothetical protein
MLSGASNFIPVAPDTWYADLRLTQTALPKPLMVFGQQHHGERSFYWMQGGPWRSSALEGEAIEWPEPNKLLRVGLQFGKLLLVTVGAELPGWTLGIWRGIHIPLWPLKGPIAYYEARAFPWYDSMRALATFCVGTQLFRGQSEE